MSTALRRKVGSPIPFGSFLSMRKEQYKIKSKLICYPFYFLLDQKVCKKSRRTFSPRALPSAKKSFG
jgi:hypothetical protein